MKNRIIAAVAALFLVLGAGVVINLAITQWEVRHSQQQWCSALDLLTARPIPSPSDPKANPSRENAYLYYKTFVDIHHRFGC
jgi:hypothetical protein